MLLFVFGGLAFQGGPHWALEHKIQFAHFAHRNALGQRRGRPGSVRRDVLRRVLRGRGGGAAGDGDGGGGGGGRGGAAAEVPGALRGDGGTAGPPALPPPATPLS